MNNVRGLIQAGGKILRSAIHKLINSVWNKEELPDQWKESISLSSQHVSAPSGHLQVKYNYITYIS
jgi:DNA-binding MltR family transcriptional regulator